MDPESMDGVDDGNDALSDTSTSVGLMDPESAAMIPVQQKIERGLRKQVEEHALQLKEIDTELKAKRTKREDTGVELYNLQQHLAKLQEQHDKAQDAMAKATQTKDTKERELLAHQQQYEEDKKKLDELRKKFFKYQGELDKLSETLLRVEQFNEQMQSEIDIDRRAAYKAEEEIQNLEDAKQQQDRLINSLNEQIKDLTEKLALYESQLDDQKRETRLAHDTLSDALAEMEAISLEKKQLLQQWQTSLIGMQRRDEALRATEDALNKQKEALLSLDNEIMGIKQNIRKEQDKNEKLTHALAKTESDVNFLEKNIDGLLEKKQKANDRFTMLKRSLDHTDTEAKKIDQECTNIENKISTIEKKIQQIYRKVRVLEDKVMETLNSQTTLKKGSDSTLQQIERMKKAIRETELQVTNMENELARIRVDTLQTQDHNSVLTMTMAQLEKELNANDNLIERMQLDIRRKHDEIERKQKHLDKLNRQYDECIVQQGETSGEGVGPLEATINNLSKAITQKSNENDTLQRDWIKAQTELVNTKNHTSKLNDSIMELKAQSTILQQKKGRLESNTQSQQQEIALLSTEMANMHKAQKKLNELISKNSTGQEDVANKNYNLETDLIRRLKERQQETIKLEDTVQDLREEKQRLMKEILESERQIMFWEKKIQIAKETEMALDPNIGKEEIIRMKQEIYIMEQRVANLKKEQKRKVEDMNKAVDHREVLRDKGKAVAVNTKNGVTKAQLQRDNARLSHEVKKKRADASNADKQIKACLQNTEQTVQEADVTKQQNEQMKEELVNLEKEINQQTLLRTRIHDERKRKNKSYQKMRDAEKGQYKVRTKADNYPTEKAKTQAKGENVVGISEQVKEHFPHLQQELEDIVQPIRDALGIQPQ